MTFRRSLVALCFALISAPATATLLDWDGDQSFDGSFDGEFGVAKNWNPDQIPAAGHMANFNAPATYVVTFTADGAADELRVVAGDVTFLSDSATARTLDVISGNMDGNVSGGALTVGSPTNPVVLNVGDIMNIGSNGSGISNVTVDGSMSAINAGVNTHNIGRNSRNGTLNVVNSATANYGGTLRIGVDNGSIGLATIELGGKLNTGNIEVATVGSNGSGTLQVRENASINQTVSGATLTVGGAAGDAGTGQPPVNIGTIDVRSGGMFSTGTGITTINATGTVNVGSVGGDIGTLNVGGDLLADGGTLQALSEGSVISLATGTTATVQNGGQWVFDVGNLHYNVDQANSVHLDEEGTLLDFTGHRFRLQGDSTMNVIGGADALIHTNFDIGNATGDGTLFVSGSGTTVIVDPSDQQMWWGRHEYNSTVTFTDEAVGSFLGGVEMMNSFGGTASTGVATTTVSGGAQVTFGQLDLAAAGGLDIGEAILSVTDGDSQVSIDGASSLNVGKAAGGSAQILVSSGAVFQMGTGDTLVGATGSITVSDATFNADGNVNLVGGSMTANTGGIVSVEGQLVLSSNASLTLDGGEVNANSGFAFSTGVFQFRDGTLTVRNGSFEFNPNQFLGNYVVHGDTADDLPHLRFGAGAAANFPNEIAIGSFGTSGEMTILEGGQVSSKLGTLAIDPDTVGNVTVSGTDGAGTPSKWITSELMQIGIGGAGNLTIDGGGEVIGETTTLGSAAGGNGTLTVSGTDSKSSHSVGLFVGGDTNQAVGTGRVLISDGGLVEVNGTLAIWESGLVALDGGILKVDSTTVVNNGTLNYVTGTFHLTDTGGYTVGANSGPIDQVLGFDHVSIPNGGGLIVDENLLVPTATSITVNSGSVSAEEIINNELVIAANSTLSTTGGLANNADLVLIDSTVEGPVNNAEGSTVTVVGAVDFNGLVSGPGNFFGPGTANFNGSMAPGASPAEVTFEGNVSLAASNTLFIEIGGTTLGDEYDSLTIAGSAELGGVLSVSLDDITPEAGQEFMVITAGSITDHGLTLGGPAADLFNLLIGSTSVILQAVTASLAGDYNGNGVVDAADYTVWRDTLGQSGVGLAADGTGPGGMPDGVVDLLDYDFWKTNFGNVAAGGGAGSASGSNAAVPEPATIGLLALAIFAFAWRRRN